MAAFLLFVSLVISYLGGEDAAMLHLFIILLAGFLWIGATALSRHALVRLKQFIGSRVGMLEFLSTQMVAIFFPLHYVLMRREVAAFKRRMDGVTDA